MTGPLSGSRVVVTRAEHQAAGLGGALHALGAEVVYLPVIAIAPPASWADLDAALRRCAGGTYAWILFTSVNSVASVSERCALLSLVLGARVGAVGGATSNALARHAVTPDLVPETATSVALAEAIGPGRGTVLLPRVEDAPHAMVEILTANGWTVDEVIAYRNVPAPPSPAAEAVRAGGFDIVTFTSGSTARNFIELVAAPDALGLAPQQPARRIVACIGPETEAAARALGFRVDVVAPDHSAAGLAEAVAARRAPSGTMGR
ncbi:hypothetical protein BH24ACT26_BH24ACT26_11820 [soil metagenome]